MNPTPATKVDAETIILQSLQLMARCKSSNCLATSAALSADAPGKELLQAVALALLDVTIGFESISEEGLFAVP